jgi:hypothetical protein
MVKFAFISFKHGPFSSPPPTPLEKILDSSKEIRLKEARLPSLLGTLAIGQTLKIRLLPLQISWAG